MIISVSYLFKISANYLYNKLRISEPRFFTRLSHPDDTLAGGDGDLNPSWNDEIINSLY
ncbi:MAG: hypothetical protein METHAR1v1_1680004 [Methanothrix sp.]|nr:MAG: hypothetical protein METHAR1v1_1680004 [Methanothrix sp.]